MDKLATLWSFVRKYKYMITIVLFVVIVGFRSDLNVNWSFPDPTPAWGFAYNDNIL